ncbi:hypothetical protein [Streptomyces spiramyceticus]|uniref:hypothetical protein n=1 Tax=Streptomyces spiramyceticus TaxID=299717 RepID=UPI00237B1EA2|nr:hypothetical protein [Streptomyces spiramyceticus]
MTNLPVTADQIRNLIDRAEGGALTADEAARLRAGVEQLIQAAQPATGTEEATRQPAEWLIPTPAPTVAARIDAIDTATPEGQHLFLITGGATETPTALSTDADYQRSRAEAYSASLDRLLDEVSPAQRPGPTRQGRLHAIRSAPDPQG